MRKHIFMGNRLVLFFVSSTVVVLLETIILSLGFLSLWVLPVVSIGFVMMLVLFLQSLIGLIKQNRENALPILVGSSIFMISFAITLVFSVKLFFMQSVTTNPDGSFNHVDIEYVFPGQTYLNRYTSPLMGGNPINVSRQFAFFFPDVIVWLLTEAIVLGMVFLKKRT